MSRHYTQRIIEHSPDIVATRFGETANCRHENWKKDGTLHGVQKYKCLGCGKQRRSKGILDDSMTRIRALAPLFKQGMNVTQASKQSGYCRQSVRAYFKKFKALAEPPLCECGRSSQHLGWCKARLQARGYAPGVLPIFVKNNLAKRWSHK